MRSSWYVGPAGSWLAGGYRLGSLDLGQQLQDLLEGLPRDHELGVSIPELPLLGKDVPQGSDLPREVLNCIA